MTAGKKILLVEDHEQNIRITGALLNELGYEYEVARNGVEAVEKRFAAPFALALMDIQMPGMDGLEATRRIRSAEHEQDMAEIPIIGMTGNATEDDRFFCLKAGMNDFLMKPFRMKSLEEKLQEFVPQ